MTICDWLMGGGDHRSRKTHYYHHCCCYLRLHKNIPGEYLTHFLIVRNSVKVSFQTLGTEVDPAVVRSNVF